MHKGILGKYLEYLWANISSFSRIKTWGYIPGLETPNMYTSIALLNWLYVLLILEKWFKIFIKIIISYSFPRGKYMYICFFLLEIVIKHVKCLCDWFSGIRNDYSNKIHYCLYAAIIHSSNIIFRYFRPFTPLTF